jgi:hypothetical protein
MLLRAGAIACSAMLASRHFSDRVKDRATGMVTKIFPASARNSIKQACLLTSMMIGVWSCLGSAHADTQLPQSILSYASSQLAQNGADVESSAANCKSTNLWRDLSGPYNVIRVGDRTLKIPLTLPYFSVENGTTRNLAWFSFHVDKSGQLSFGGSDASQPFPWKYLLTFHLADAQGRVDDKVLLRTFLQGLSRDPKMSAESGGYDVYPEFTEDWYVKTSASIKIMLACMNNISSYPGPQVPACTGYSRPWPNAALTYTFGRQLLPVAPAIAACITDMLQYFAR